jgi:hypothetical protein
MKRHYIGRASFVKIAVETLFLGSISWMRLTYLNMGRIDEAIWHILQRRITFSEMAERNV